MKKVLLIVIAFIIIGGGAFYGGMKYAESRNSKGQFSHIDFQNLSPEERQQKFQEMGAAGIVLGGDRIRGRTGSGFVTGEIISKDNQSITIKLQDGSSKIIFFSDSVQIFKTTEGTIKDIEIDKQIMVSGSQNPDGSYTARTIQLSSRFLVPRNSE